MTTSSSSEIDKAEGSSPQGVDKMVRSLIGAYRKDTEATEWLQGQVTSLLDRTPTELSQLLLLPPANITNRLQKLLSPLVNTTAILATTQWLGEAVAGQTPLLSLVPPGGIALLSLLPPLNSSWWSGAGPIEIWNSELESNLRQALLSVPGLSPSFIDAEMTLLKSVLTGAALSHHFEAMYFQVSHG